MTMYKNWYESMPDTEKVVYEDFCKTLGLDLENSHSYALWFEFKKSKLTW